MSRPFAVLGNNGTSGAAGGRHFTIDDAFEEEEDDDSIRVLAGGKPPDAQRPDVAGGNGAGDAAGTGQPAKNGPQSYKMASDVSRDSDSLIQECCDSSVAEETPAPPRLCFQHPKVRENWRMVLAAVFLLVVGVGLLATGTLAMADPEAGLQGAVFLIAGFICFIPGAYHVVYIYLAAKGKRGYHFHNLPLFT